MNRDLKSSSVVVVGAGAAGLMAAIFAARSGARVIVCEQLPEAGARLLATGGGHCNFTNTLATDDFIRRFGEQSRFVAPALRAFDGNRLRLFFEELGVASHSPDGFHVFPVSNSARAIRSALLQTCKSLGVEFRFNRRVDKLLVAQGRVTGIQTAHGTESAARVVLAAGGASYPKLGGGESGFRLARLAGHTIVPLCPALVPLITRERWPATLAGVTLPRVSIRCAFQCGQRGTGTGSLLFTHKGISGPAALDISGVVALGLMARSSVNVTLDLLPDRTMEAWQAQIQQMRKEHGAKTVLSLFGESAPAALVRVVLDLAQIPPVTPAAQLSRAQSRALFMLTRNLPLTISGTAGLGKAMVTKGGISLDEVCPKTLESRRVPGLFFAGEILDVDGACGGFNLHWAFASGFLTAARATTK